MTRGYTTRDVAKLLDVSIARVRGYVRARLVEPARGPRGAQIFAFQDLVLLRVARDLAAARVPRSRIARSLRQLKASLPEGRSLSGLQIDAEADRVVVHDGDKRWNPESGQLHFRFGIDDIARRAAPIARRRAREAREARLGAEEWYELGCELETPAPREAREAYRRSLELDPEHADAHINLGRLLHEADDLPAAESHYRIAFELDPGDATAAFNLGVVLEDLGRPEEALNAYAHAGDLADAHFNASGVCERLGRHTAALRHLKSYRSLK